MFLKLNLTKRFLSLFKNFLFITLLVGIASITYAENLQKFSVLEVIDGDTITIKIKDKIEKVRLLGIQAPEIFTDPPQDFGFAAKAELNKLLNNQKVIIKYDKKFKRDKYKRILADVYVADSNLWINGYLVEKGFAFTYILNKNPIPKIKELIQLENQAISQNLNIWQNNKVISFTEAEDYIGSYKIVEGIIVDTLTTKNTLWLQLSPKKEKGFSLRIPKNNIDNISEVFNLNTIKGKKVRVRGYIDKYSVKYGAFIEIVSPYMIEIM
ncbi:MAG: thermonuclease family protein [Alphaproteobacteria bacterium]|nr:thermonuclease family protein [Alphaproteobacteria bacterium]